MTRKEPNKGQSYEVLPTPASVTLDFVPGSLFEVSHDGISETNVFVHVTDLNSIRLPLDANPRLPEHLPVVQEIQDSATGDNASRFVYMNNGIDVFCQSVTRASDPRRPGEQIDTLRVEFAGSDAKDGLCNGGITYYSLQKLSHLTTDPLVKVRFYRFEGANLAIKASIARAKNANRAVSSTDDANFMGYFDRLREKLGSSRRLVKWNTGDTEVVTGDVSPLSVADLVRYLTALRLEETWHWSLNTSSADPFRSHAKREDLVRNGGVHVKRFIANMSNEEG